MPRQATAKGNLRSPSSLPNGAGVRSAKANPIALTPNTDTTAASAMSPVGVRPNEEHAHEHGVGRAKNAEPTMILTPSVHCSRSSSFMSSLPLQAEDYISKKEIIIRHVVRSRSAGKTTRQGAGVGFGRGSSLAS